MSRFNIITPSNGDVLTYDSANDWWENASASAGSDPWTTVPLLSDFSSTNTTASPDAITGWYFTPAANTVYLLEFHALAYAAATATGIRPGYASMSGTIECGMQVNVPNGAAAAFIRNLFGVTTQNSAATASVSATAHYMYGQGMLIAGASPGSDFQMTLASETPGSAVTLLAGSIFRYREVG